MKKLLQLFKIKEKNPEENNLYNFQSITFKDDLIPFTFPNVGKYNVGARTKR